MTTTEQSPQLPNFLQSFLDYTEHLRDQFEDKENNEKGDAFVTFAVKLIPLLGSWPELPAPKINEKKTRDGGIDFISKSEDHQIWVCGQSKYRIREVAEIDSVISKFQNFQIDTYRKFDEKAGTTLLFQEPAQTVNSEKKPKKKGKKSATDVDDTQGSRPNIKFMLVTSSDIENLLNRYSQQSLPSKSFYETLMNEGRLEIIHGQKLFDALVNLYRQQFFIPSEIELNLEEKYIQCDKVYISVLTGKTLSSLYEKHGSSLFFENIREFLGTQANSAEMGNVNNEIIETLRSNPERMLGRNNGVTIKAEKIEAISEKQLKLSNCSIVNGCQTTMCIVQAGASAANAKVLAKIVEEQDSWDIAKSANYQNSVSRLELDLARYLRPQSIRKTATNSGYSIQPSEDLRSISNVLDSISKDRISYEALRTLVLGVFSRFPNNMFTSNYSELRIDIIGEFYKNNEGETLSEMLFKLLQAMKDSVEIILKRSGFDSYKELFRRFFNDDKPQYQCLMVILTACYCTKTKLSDKPASAKDGYQLIKKFLVKLDTVLTSYKSHFASVFRLAFVVLATKILEEGSVNDAEVMQKMYREIKTASGSNFPNLLKRLDLQIESSNTVIEETPTFDDE